VNYYYLDKVMAEWNKRFKDVELIYSNPKNYLETVKQTNADFKNKAPKNPNLS